MALMAMLSTYKHTAKTMLLWKLETVLAIYTQDYDAWVLKKCKAIPVDVKLTIGDMVLKNIPLSSEICLCCLHSPNILVH